MRREIGEERDWEFILGTTGHCSDATSQLYSDHVGVKPDERANRHEKMRDDFASNLGHCD